jgi:hypothetical protein
MTTLCDRCSEPAVIVVRCYQGCSHQQCAGCARQTQQERDDSQREEEAIEYDPAFAEEMRKASLFDIDYMKLAFGRANGRSTPTR